MRFRISAFILTLTLLYLSIPVVATIFYSFAGDWHKTVLPEYLTLKWYAQILSDSQVIWAIIRSVVLSGVATIAAMVITVPMIFAVLCFAPRLEKILQGLVALTYCLPGIILVVGLIRSYGGLGVNMLVVVVGAYILTLFPIIYQCTKNTLMSINVKQLLEAANLLGSGTFSFFLKIILPSMKNAMVLTALLSFSMVFGEFAIVNMLVGSNYETVQMVLYGLIKKSGHLASALSSCYFLLIGAITFFVIKLSSKGASS